MLCHLGTGKTVPGEGPVRPKVIVVGDYPGPIDHKNRRPMLGASGTLMRKALSAVVGLDIENEVFFTNVIKCFPKESDKVRARELVICRKWLDQELAQVKSPVIVVVGERAKSVLLPNVTKPIAKIHGTLYHDPLHNWRIFVTWSPVTIDTYSAKTEEGERWMPTLSPPWLFMQDMLKLKDILSKIE